MTTVAQLRELPDLDNETKYPDAALQAVIEGVEGYAERYLGTALSPTTATIEAPAGLFMFGWSGVTAVTDTDDVAVTGWASTGLIESSGARTLKVTYGFAETPPLLERYLQDEMRRELLARSARLTRNTLREVGSDGMMTVYSYADWVNCRPFGSPALDTILNDYSHRPPGSA